MTTTALPASYRREHEHTLFDGPPHQLRDETLKTIYGGQDWLQ